MKREIFPQNLIVSIQQIQLETQANFILKLKKLKTRKARILEKTKIKFEPRFIFFIFLFLICHLTSKYKRVTVSIIMFHNKFQQTNSKKTKNQNSNSKLMIRIELIVLVFDCIQVKKSN